MDDAACKVSMGNYHITNADERPSFEINSVAACYRGGYSRARYDTKKVYDHDLDIWYRAKSGAAQNCKSRPYYIAPFSS